MMYLIHLGYLGYDQDAQTAFIPNEEIRQELTAATRRNTKNISVSLRNYNKNIAYKKHRIIQNAVFLYAEHFWIIICTRPPV